MLEDTWVTGGHSQAIAVALKLAGAAPVTILPICLLLNPSWPPNAEIQPVTTSTSLESRDLPYHRIYLPVTASRSLAPVGGQV